MACVCHSSAGGQGQIQQKNLVTGLYPSLQDRRTHLDTATSDSSISIPTGVPTSKYEEPFLQPLCKKPCRKRLHSLSQTDVMVKDKLFVPELFFSCPEQRCLQHSTIYHPQQPLVKLSVGHNTRGCYPGTLPQHRQGGFTRAGGDHSQT